MSTLADFLNAPSTIEVDGVSYRLRQPTQLEQATFQRNMEKRAHDHVERQLQLSDDTRAKMHAQVTHDSAAGVYEWGGELCAKRLQTPEGVAELVWIVAADQGMTLAIARKLVDQQMRQIAAILSSRATDDPKDRAAILKTLGLPSDYLSRNSRTRRSTKPSRKSRR